MGVKWSEDNLKAFEARQLKGRLVRKVRDNARATPKNRSNGKIAATQSPAKYRNKKVEFKGQIFDSQKEFKRYLILKQKEDNGEIEGLLRQVPVPIVHNGVKICKWIADFAYLNSSGEDIYEDVKGYRGGSAYAMFRLKKKLVLAFHGIDIIEI